MEARKVILLVDDNQSFIDLFLTLPETEAYDIIATTSAASALETVKKQPVNVIISIAGRRKGRPGPKPSAAPAVAVRLELLHP